MTSSGAPQSTPGVPASRARTHVVHDKATGAILHVHHTVEFEGGAAQAEAPEDRALRLARAGSEAAVVEVDPAEVDHRRSIRIDPETGRVIPA
ncbi:MAG: hypothetical protein ABI376_09715 [Caulobacteraceae bacterium]